MANIAEGFGRYTLKDSKQYYIAARASAAEVQSHLYIALDQSYVDRNAFDAAFQQSVLVNKLINGLIKHTRELMDS